MPAGRAPTLDLVGCGAVSRLYHVPLLRRAVVEGRVTVAGCYDLDRSVARAAASDLGAKRWGSPDDIRPGTAGACIVATPPETHADLATPYLQAGSSVLVEKPAATSRSELETMLRVADEHQAIIQVNHMRRLYPAVRASRRMLATVGSDTVRFATVTEGSRWSWPSRSDYIFTNPYGGVLFDVGSHVLDSLIFILGLDIHQDLGSCLDLRVRRSPDREPSHDYRAEFTFEHATVGRIAVRVRVSRCENIAGQVRLGMEAGTLVVPTAFAGRAVMWSGSEAFAISPAEGQYSSALSCIDAVQRSILIRHDEDRVQLDDVSGRRFIAVQRLLDTLSHGGDGE